MIGRVVEVDGPGRFLRKRRGFLVVECEGEELGRVPLDDLAAVIVSHPAAAYTQGLVVALAERGVPLVACGERREPVAWLLPVSGHHRQTARFRAQASARRPLTKQLWRRIVQAKIRGQAAVLAATGREAGGLRDLAARVRSGDPENIEAQAARRYWPALLGKAFRRGRGGPMPNPLLDYGYTILRSATARAITACGLHPSLGIHHHRADNPLCLADDLMEPFRPAVDHRVWSLLGDGARDLDAPTRSALVDLLSCDIPTEAGRSPLSTAVLRLVQSVARSFESGTLELAVPASVLPAEPGPC